jgi:hypothetical protein
MRRSWRFFKRETSVSWQNHFLRERLPRRRKLRHRTVIDARNFIKGVLSQGFCGAVAPTIRVKLRGGARRCPVFYDAPAKRTVVERVQKVRQRGLDAGAPDNMRASYLSYVAFAHADLRLLF